MNKQLFLMLIACSIAYCKPISAQVNYNSEQNKIERIWKEKRGLYFNMYSNSFFKNNEYFLNTASGYTLFGSQNIPTIIYKPYKNLFVQAGMYLKKDFGTEGFVKTAPYYLISLQKNGYSLSLGNIKSNVGHRMYDPMFAYERLMSHNLEEGLSLKVNRKRIYSELWINWETQQYWLSDFNEQFTFGNNTNVSLFKNNNFKLALPIQLLAIHSGGQLDTSGLPTSTIVNASVGIDFTREFDRAASINMVNANFNYLIYKDLSENAGLPYTNGDAIYANLNIGFLKNFRGSLSYWQSNQFIAPKGDILYQSISHNPGKMNYFEPKRQLIQLGIAYQKRIAKNANISVLAQPFYDFQNQRVDYSYSLFLSFQPNIRLFKNIP
ncbi:MAG TPA: hypothetical protein VLZ83_10485 [Edaphocola sp.]|nr:hypothetical protein [Edaphocola sp.]